MKFSPDPQPEQSAPERDILHTLHKHRWKILATFIFVSAAIAAVALKTLSEPMFSSHAKLLVGFAVENSDASTESKPRQTPIGPSDLIETERTILKSYNVALDTADAIGPDQLSSATTNDAAKQISTGLKVTSQPGSNIIEISYQNHSAELAYEVLETLIQKYFIKHLETHQPPSADFTEISAKADQLHNQLRETEEEISSIKEQVGTSPTEAEMVATRNAKLETLEKQRQIEDVRYRSLASRIEKARKDAVTDSTNTPNIALIQQPSTPVHSDGRGTRMVALAIATVGVIAGLALAFIPAWLIHRRELSTH